MLKSSLNKSKKRNGRPVLARSRRKSSEPTKANSGSRTSSAESNNGMRPKNSTKHSRDPKLDALLDRAFAQKNAGEFRDATKTLKEAVRLFPNDGLAHWLLGAIFLSELKLPKKAIPYFERAIRIAPKSEKASLGLFHSLWATDKRVE